MSGAVYCLCSEETTANAVLTELRTAGFGAGISVMLQDRSDTRNISLKEDVARGAGLGSAAGALLALTLPGIGSVFAAGPLVAMIGGAAAGGVIGGLAAGTGAFQPLGLPDQVAERLHRGVTDGAILVAVHADEDDPRRDAIRICRNAGADEVYEVVQPRAA